MDDPFNKIYNMHLGR